MTEQPTTQPQSRPDGDQRKRADINRPRIPGQRISGRKQPRRAGSPGKAGIQPPGPSRRKPWGKAAYWSTKDRQQKGASLPRLDREFLFQGGRALLSKGPALGRARELEKQLCLPFLSFSCSVSEVPELSQTGSVHFKQELGLHVHVQVCAFCDFRRKHFIVLE